MTGALLALVVRIWIATLRVRVIGANAVPEPHVLAFFHGSQMLALSWRFLVAKRPLGVLVSLSRDGALQAALLGRLGFRIARGSSTRGGAQGLRSLVRLARAPEGVDCAIAVDGPRGPYGLAKPGIVALSRLIPAAIVPLGAACSRSILLKKTWDRFRIPLPFSQVVLTVGAPLVISRSGEGSHDEAAITEAIAACETRAEEILRGMPV